MPGSEIVDVRAAVSAVASIDVTELSNEDLAQFVIETELLMNALHATSAMALVEFQQRGSWAGDGCLSAAGWVAGRTGTPRRSLQARVRAGAALRLLPSATVPARAGSLSPQHLGVLAGCVRRHPELAARDEAVLVGQAQALDAEAFAAAARHWQACAAAVDGPDPAAAEVVEPIDELHVSRTFDGRYRLDGTFSADSGELIGAALEAEVDRALRAGRDGDPSVPVVTSQVRAAALVDLVGQAMRRNPSDASVPDRYRVALVVAHDVGELPVAACDSPAFRAVLGAGSEVLDVGRLTQQWPSGVRRAITLRDGGCVFPGCDRPPSWCDVHHCLPWLDSGRTSVGNGALLCRRHHTFVHRQHWTVRVEDGRPVTRTPDGAAHLIGRWDSSPPRPLRRAG